MTYDRLALLPFSFLVATGCFATTTPAEGPFTKEEGATLMGRSEVGTDICDLEGWYGDGACDDFCVEPDPDCADCLATPSCNPGERAHRDASECPADASCRMVSVCGTTIWCSDTATCAAVPTCGPGETEHARWEDCPADASCREVTECDATIWCSDTCTTGPMCGRGEAMYERPEDCPADATCREVTACGTSIWCMNLEFPPEGCVGPNPEGCFSDDDCDAGSTCDGSMSAPSGCVCDTKTRSWVGTPDLSGGVCVAT